MGEISRLARMNQMSVEEYLTDMLTKHGSYRKVAKAIDVTPGAVSARFRAMDAVTRNRGQLEQMASDNGQTTVEYINSLIALHGSIKAAAYATGYARTTLVYHLKKGAK